MTEALGGARQQVDAQFGQYRDTAADQIEALAKGAKSFVSELESKDTLGMSDYLSDMAESMSGLAGSLRGKSAEQLLHDGADLARNNPALFIAGSIALGFGLSRFLKAGSALRRHSPMPATRPPATQCLRQAVLARNDPMKLPLPSRTDQGPGLATGITPASPNEQDHPSDFATTVDTWFDILQRRTVMNREDPDLPDSRPLPVPDQDASVVGLLRQLSREVPDLFTKELALAKAELAGQPHDAQGRHCRCGGWCDCAAGGVHHLVDVRRLRPEHGAWRRGWQR